jgi:hypothetical protein
MGRCKGEKGESSRRYAFYQGQGSFAQPVPDIVIGSRRDPDSAFSSFEINPSDCTGNGYDFGRDHDLKSGTDIIFCLHHGSWLEKLGTYQAHTLLIDILCYPATAEKRPHLEKEHNLDLLPNSIPSFMNKFISAHE